MGYSFGRALPKAGSETVRFGEMNMRILILGAGGTGGYFGGRLLEHGRDVTFLVRRRRAELLREKGLVIESPAGSLLLRDPPTVTAGELGGRWDLVILSCKAYGLMASMEDIAPAVGENTAVLPLLNGMRHIDLLSERFGREHVLGGLCRISVVLGGDGVIRHLNSLHSLTYGELDGSFTERMTRITRALSNAGFDADPSGNILQGMWDKWVSLASLAAITCLMRAPVGDIVAAPGGREAAFALLAECCAIAERAGFAPERTVVENARAMLSAAGSPLTASMCRDLLQGGEVEADHVLGDLLARSGRKPGDAPSVLSIAYAHLKAYEAGRARRRG